MDRKLGVLIGLLVLIGALVAVILIGRGGGDSEESSGSVPEEVISAVTENLEEKPQLAGSSATPPTALVKKDIVVGDGAEAKQGDTVSVQYVGTIFDSGDEFDASWQGTEPGTAFEFQLGGGQVIQGWDQGVEGMKVGGRRVLVIPPDLGYGPQGNPPTIPANSTLVFVVDLEDVQGQ